MRATFFLLLTTAALFAVAQTKSTADFSNARLGIFIHYTPASVVGYADTSVSFPQTVIDKGWRYYFKNNCYSEWLGNSLKIKNSAARKYLGNAVNYDSIVNLFYQTPRLDTVVKHWTNVVASSGAKYVLYVTKHHDGELLLPPNYSAGVNDAKYNNLSFLNSFFNAMVERNIRIGYYYSTGLDWKYEPRPIKDAMGLFAAIPQSYAYVKEVEHWNKQLIFFHDNFIYHADIAMPARVDMATFIKGPQEYYSNRTQQLKAARWLIKTPVLKEFVRPFFNYFARQSLKRPKLHGAPYADFLTTENYLPLQKPDKPWQYILTLGKSFGYCKFDSEATCPTAKQIAELFIKVLKLGGNLCINIGPMVDGTIPPYQVKVLAEFGQWVKRNETLIWSGQYDGLKWD